MSTAPSQSDLAQLGSRLRHRKKQGPNKLDSLRRDLLALEEAGHTGLFFSQSNTGTHLSEEDGPRARLSWYFRPKKMMPGVPPDRQGDQSTNMPFLLELLSDEGYPIVTVPATDEPWGRHLSMADTAEQSASAGGSQATTNPPQPTSPVTLYLRSTLTYPISAQGTERQVSAIKFYTTERGNISTRSIAPHKGLGYHGRRAITEGRAVLLYDDEETAQ